MFNQIRKNDPLYISSIDKVVLSITKDTWERWSVFFIHDNVEQSILNRFPVFSVVFLTLEKSKGRLLARIDGHPSAKVNERMPSLFYMYCDLLVRRLVQHAKRNLHTHISMTTGVEMMVHSLLDHGFTVKRNDTEFKALLKL